jgi:Mce-associated membrane protein
VKTTVGDGPEQEPRAWRMRVTVQKVGNDVKVADVEFVS